MTSDSIRHAVEGVRALWPYLEPCERYEWIERIAEAAGWSFIPTFEIISGLREMPR